MRPWIWSVLIHLCPKCATSPRFHLVKILFIRDRRHQWSHHEILKTCSCNNVELYSIFRRHYHLKVLLLLRWSFTVTMHYLQICLITMRRDFYSLAMVLIAWVFTFCFHNSSRLHLRSFPRCLSLLDYILLKILY